MNIIGMTVPEFPMNSNVIDIVNKYKGKLVDFYSMNMDDLQIIAKYRLLPVPSVLVIESNQVIGRICKDIPNVDEFTKLLDNLK